MSRETRDEREAFIAAYGICSTRGRLYGRDELVAYVSRDPRVRLFHVTRAEIRAILTHDFLRRRAGTVPARIADDVLLVLLGDERQYDHTAEATCFCDPREGCMCLPLPGEGNATTPR